MDDYVLALGNCERTRLLRKGIFSKSCMAQGRVEIWAPTAKQCQTNIWHSELSIPSDCQDCNPTQTLRKQSKLQPSTLDRTPAPVPVFGFSLAFPSFLLLTLGNSCDTPHWTKFPPARNSHIMTGPVLPDLTTCSLAGNSATTTNPSLAGRSRDKFAATFPPLLRMPGGKVAWSPFNWKVTVSQKQENQVGSNFSFTDDWYSHL